MIFPDLPPDEADHVVEACKVHDLSLSFLIPPTAPIERAQKIAAMSTGFVYVVARAGITGARAELPTDLPDRLAKLREVTDVPMTVGFGISNAEHVKAVVAKADAAIVGLSTGEAHPSGR